MLLFYNVVFPVPYRANKCIIREYNLYAMGYVGTQIAYNAVLRKYTIDVGMNVILFSAVYWSLNVIPIVRLFLADTRKLWIPPSLSVHLLSCSVHFLIDYWRQLGQKSCELQEKLKETGGGRMDLVSASGLHVFVEVVLHSLELSSRSLSFFQQYLFTLDHTDAQEARYRLCLPQHR